MKIKQVFMWAAAVLLLIVLLGSNYAVAEEPSGQAQTTDPKAASVTAPNLAEIIPLAAELSGRLAALENKVKDELGLASLEQNYTHILTNIDTYARQLQQVKDSGDYRTTKLTAVLQKVEKEHERLDVISKPFIREIYQFDELRQQWLKEQETWNQWQSDSTKDGAPEQVHSFFADVNKTITAAVNLIDSQLGTVLAEHEKIGDIQEQIFALDAELENLIMERRFGTFLYSSPVMFSSDYLSQFTPDLWKAFLEGLDGTLRIGSGDWGQLGWIFFIELVVFGILMIFMYRNRQALQKSTYWHFIAEHTFSAGLFLVCMITMLIYEYKEFPLIWKLVNAVIIAISFARLVGSLTQISWQRYFVYGLTALLITNGLLQFLNFPIPLFRLFIVLAGAIGLICCWKWSNENKCLEGRMYYTRLLRLGSVFFTIIVIAEIWGIESLAFYLLFSVTKTTFFVLIIMVFVRIIHGAVEWLFHTSALSKAVVLYSGEIDSVIRRIMHFVNITVCGLILLPGILTIWGVYDSLERATIGFWKFGFNIGSQRVSVGLAIIVMSVLSGSFFVSWIFQQLFLDVLLRKQQLQRGVRVSIERLIHYSVIFVGFVLAISILGIDLT
jgi:potassium efflux system protein